MFVLRRDLDELGLMGLGPQFVKGGHMANAAPACPRMKIGQIAPQVALGVQQIKSKTQLKGLGRQSLSAAIHDLAMFCL